MKIAVCVSHVPDTATKIKIGADEKMIDPAGVVYIINPYDEFSVEESLKTKEKFGGEVIAVSVGNDNSKETIRKSLAMGVDRGILLKCDRALDSYGIAKALSEELKNYVPNIIFMGKQSVDYDDAIVGQLTSEMLGISCITNVIELKIDGQKITAEREIEGGKEVVESELPIIITTQKGLNEPRYASLKGIMAAKKKEIAEKQVGDFSNLTEVLKIKKPAEKQSGRIVGTDASAVPELVRLLHEEAKVI